MLRFDPLPPLILESLFSLGILDSFWGKEIIALSQIYIKNMEQKACNCFEGPLYSGWAVNHSTQVFLHLFVLISEKKWKKENQDQSWTLLEPNSSIEATTVWKQLFQISVVQKVLE